MSHGQPPIRVDIKYKHNVYPANSHLAKAKDTHQKQHNLRGKEKWPKVYTVPAKSFVARVHKIDNS